MLPLNSNYLTGVRNTVLRQLETQSREALYFSRPDLWAKDFLGVQLWRKQAEVALSVVDNSDVVVKAGHETGKSFLAGILICWWIDTREHLPGGAFVVSTAPSTSQINAIVWKEVRINKAIADKRYAEFLSRKKHNQDLGEYAVNDHPLPGYITADAHWKLDSGQEIGYGRRPPQGSSDSMSGIHARYVLTVGDEAVGLPEDLIDDLGNIASNETSRRFLICNPTNPLSYVAKIFKEDTGTWKYHTISVFDSPNFHGGGTCECCPDLPFGEGLPIHVLESLVGHKYAEDRERDWGLDSPKYVSRVLGEFAWDMGLTLISMEDMAVALDTMLDTEDMLPELGVDVSRSKAGDMNTVYENKGGRVRHVDAWNERNAMTTAERINRLALQTGAYVVKVDASGLGGPIVDRVIEHAAGRYAVVEMLGGNPSPDKNRYYNARAFWYLTLQEAMRDGLVDIDPDDKELQEELLGMEYKYPDSGKQSILIESKKDMRKRGVGSPDFADAANYSFVDVSKIVYPPSGPSKGDRVAFDPNQFLNDWRSQLSGPGLPV